MSGLNFRPVVLAAREQLKTGREKLRQLHQAGTPGLQVCARLAELWDSIVQTIFDAALAEFGDDELASNLAVIAHGGYGRQDVAPFSDVDLMLLRAPGLPDERVQPIAQRLHQDIGDAGLILGFSQRTSDEACNFAMQDTTVFTSISESRRVAGSESLFEKFMSKLRRKTKSRWRTLIAAIDRARVEERRNYGETVYLLQPNIKRSSGGLRDLQLLRWIGFARYGESDPQNLERLGALLPEDRRRLRQAHEFLLRLRNEMHFHANKAQDGLDRPEQIRLAELFEYEPDQGWVPVEVFMRDYFHHTGEIQHSVANFLASVKRSQHPVRSAITTLSSVTFEGDFRVSPVDIAATRRGLAKLRGNLEQVLRLLDIANLLNKWIDHATWEAIRQDMLGQQEIDLTPHAAKRFLSLFSQPPRLGESLRRLHELRVLERIIPGMTHARCLLQFNDYHQYTVDEHSIRAVEEATRFTESKDTVGEVYRQIKDKGTLHLALLIHDLGKGYPEDHSEVGAKLAEETARRLNLPPRQAETLRFLVHKHLLLARYAMWRDTSDPGVAVDLAVQTGSPEVLQMLYVLTCADVAAVGPGSLNRWKYELITSLYHKSMQRLTGSLAYGESDPRSGRGRELVRQQLKQRANEDWLREQIAALPVSYLESTPPERIAAELLELQSLPENGVAAWGRYQPDRKAVEYTIGTYDAITPGIFHRLTGVLTSQGHQILAADINPLSRGMVLDRFYVFDLDFEGEPPADRIEGVCRKLADALKNPSDKPPTFRRLWGADARAASRSAKPVPTDVKVDNSTSDNFTIVDIFANDRIGLLYTITRKLFELGLSVHVAKIGSHQSQVVDVFYVADRGGGKIYDETRLQRIHDELLAEITRFEAG